jgi:hypothetical protein
VVGICVVAFWIGVVNPTSANPVVAPPDVRTVEHLRQHVRALTTLPAARQYSNPEALAAAADYIRGIWRQDGLEVEEQPYDIGARHFRNLLVRLGPKDGGRIVVGAHYDVCGEKPGADDNASGVAGLLELGRLLLADQAVLRRRVDLVAYSTEEPPFFATSDMGSARHAAWLRAQGADVVAMLSLEMLGYYSGEPGSQEFPVPGFSFFYPTTGNYIVLVARPADWQLVRRIKPLMQHAMKMRVYSANAPRMIPGIDWSDQRAYWDMGYPALMVTDTSFLRNHNYHEETDTIDTLDFVRMADVVRGVEGAVLGL